MDGLSFVLWYLFGSLSNLICNCFSIESILTPQYSDLYVCFQWICSYLFWPLSILMGVHPGEAREVAKLVGIKVFTSEMLAYQELGKSIINDLSVSARQMHWKPPA